MYRCKLVKFDRKAKRRIKIEVQTKVYHDGSHYVGIQRTPRESRCRPREKEEVFFFDGEPTEEERKMAFTVKAQ